MRVQSDSTPIEGCKRDVNGTEEASYVASLRWQWDGVHFLTDSVPPATRNRLSDIFHLWRIGWHASSREGYIVIYVPKRQFDRVCFKPEIKDDQQTTDTDGTARG